MSEKVVIVAAGRTAVGTFGGSLSGIQATHLEQQLSQVCLIRLALNLNK